MCYEKWTLWLLFLSGGFWEVMCKESTKHHEDGNKTHPAKQIKAASHTA